MKRSPWFSTCFRWDKPQWWLLASLLALHGFGVSTVADDLATPAPTSVPGLELHAEAVVDSSGIYLDQLFRVPASGPLPHLRLASPPSFGKSLQLSATQVVDLLRRESSELANQTIAGAESIRILRRSRPLESEELQSLLVEALQRDAIKGNAELELKLTRAWNPIAVPDEALTINIVTLPASGIGAYFIVRFEILAGAEVLGSWQTAAQAKLWGEVVVAQEALRNGQVLRATDLATDRLDLLTLRDALTPQSFEESTLELIRNVQAGEPILARHVRLRPAIRRGRLVEAVIREGLLNITMKVEALEDGLLGQTVRVRNPKTRREFYGKIQNEETVLVTL